MSFKFPVCFNKQSSGGTKTGDGLGLTLKSSNDSTRSFVEGVVGRVELQSSHNNDITLTTGGWTYSAW